MPEPAVDWNGRPITLVRTRGGVAAVSDFSDNLIRDDRLPWPPPPVVQKLYESRQSRAFDPPELAAAMKRLGFYSDLQSLNSEDAITWSYFGSFLAETRLSTRDRLAKEPQVVAGAEESSGASSVGASPL